MLSATRVGWGRVSTYTWPRPPIRDTRPAFSAALSAFPVLGWSVDMVRRAGLRIHHLLLSSSGFSSLLSSFSYSFFFYSPLRTCRQLFLPLFSISAREADG